MSWKPNIIKCINCGDAMHEVCSSASTGAYVYWCDMCGTVLTANANEPISTDDFLVPQVAKNTDLPVRRLPVPRTWK